MDQNKIRDFWNNRYSKPEFAYGEKPNEFFKQQINRLIPGKLLMPAEGEGRNAVYAATKGWEVTAFDTAKEGKKKALELAKKNNVEIKYLVGELKDLNLKADEFDAVGLVFAHFTTQQRFIMHESLDRLLRKGGYIIMEAFSSNHTTFQQNNPKAGGPDNTEMLYSTDQIKQDFKNYKIVKLAEEVVHLLEGVYHEGMASVTRFVGIKL